MNRVKQQLFADYPLNKGQRMIQIIFHIIFDRLHVSYDHVLMAKNEILPSRSISSYCFVLSQKKKKKKKGSHGLIGSMRIQKAWC